MSCLPRPCSAPAAAKRTSIPFLAVLAHASLAVSFSSVLGSHGKQDVLASMLWPGSFLHMQWLPGRKGSMQAGVVQERWGASKRLLRIFCLLMDMPNSGCDGHSRCVQGAQVQRRSLHRPAHPGQLRRRPHADTFRGVQRRVHQGAALWMGGFPACIMQQHSPGSLCDCYKCPTGACASWLLCSVSHVVESASGTCSGCRASARRLWRCTSQSP